MLAAHSVVIMENHQNHRRQSPLHFQVPAVHVLDVPTDCAKQTHRYCIKYTLKIL